MRVPRKVVFIIGLTDTICTAQKACREISIILQIFTHGFSDVIMIGHISFTHRIGKKGPGFLYFHFLSDKEWFYKNN